MAETMPERLLEIIRNVDLWLDAEVAGDYKDQPLGQDWARVAKVAEETGEAIAALIAMTGQNPRKGVCGTLDELLGELADVAVTGMFAIQHFSKDADETLNIVMKALEKAASRAAKAGYGEPALPVAADLAAPEVGGQLPLPGTEAP